MRSTRIVRLAGRRRPDGVPLVDRVEAEAQAAIGRRSALWFGAFAVIFARALRRDFHAVRMARAGPPPPAGTPHLVVYCNHPSWWDAALIPVLIARLFPDRVGFAPIDAAMIARYGFMTRIGAFGVAQNTPRGAATFLKAAGRILATPGNLLFVTAQGRFTDARERPVRLAPGLAHLIERVPQATVVPMAIEYTFWDERKPEALLRFGAPFIAAELAGRPRDERATLLASRLQRVMDDLARDAATRDPAAFETLLSGRVGVGGVYDLYRRARSALRGERFVAAHGERP